MGWSAFCECGIQWPYYITFCNWFCNFDMAVSSFLLMMHKNAIYLMIPILDQIYIYK